jgi:hypothetical protein
MVRNYDSQTPCAWCHLKQLKIFQQPERKKKMFKMHNLIFNAGVIYLNQDELYTYVQGYSETIKSDMSVFT